MEPLGGRALLEEGGFGELVILPHFLLLCVVEDMVSQVPRLAIPAIMGLPL